MSKEERYAQILDILRTRGDVDYVISDADFFDLVEKPENAKTTFIKA